MTSRQKIIYALGFLFCLLFNNGDGYGTEEDGARFKTSKTVFYVILYFSDMNLVVVLFIHCICVSDFLRFNNH